MLLLFRAYCRARAPLLFWSGAAFFAFAIANILLFVDWVNYDTWNLAISGIILLGYWVIGLFFFRFWRKNSDRFFLFFACTFWLLAVERILLLAIRPNDEAKAFVYIVRLIAFLFIIYAIFDKNRASRPNPKGRRD